METLKTEIVRTTIDLPAELNRKLLRNCEKTKRSRHAEMIYLLEQSFETVSENGKREKTK